VVQRYPFWWLKLGDFGVSKAIAERLVTVVGTTDYAAPELFDPTTQEYTSAVDMWSLGCLTYWVLTGAIPFPGYGVGGTSVHDFIRDKTHFPVEPLQEENVSPKGIDFLQSLIVAKASDRVSATRALQHPWLAKLQQWGQSLEQRAKSRGHPQVR
jgi:serine/threonine/tyrosine protein kinase RAD53